MGVIIARQKSLVLLEVFFWVRIAKRENENLSKKIKFFRKNLFKTHFSLDNKGIRKICHAEFDSE